MQLSNCLWAQQITAYLAPHQLTVLNILKINAMLPLLWSASTTPPSTGVVLLKSALHCSIALLGNRLSVPRCMQCLEESLHRCSTL
jgi:hypothetical protein